MKMKFNTGEMIKAAVTSVVTGGVNAGVDYAIDRFAPQYVGTTADIAKVVAGAVISGSSFGKRNKMVAGAADGLAAIGAANLVSDLLEEYVGGSPAAATPEGAAGLVPSTIGRARLGNGAYIRRHGKVSGLGSAFGA